MQKNPDRKDEAPEIPAPRKTKRKRRETECQVKLRSGEHCGVCGSGDIVAEVLRYCRDCPAERFDIMSVDEAWRASALNKGKPICGCSEQRRLYSERNHQIVHCNACRAHKGPLCPNCRHSMWYRFAPPKKHCTYCGFQIP